MVVAYAVDRHSRNQNHIGVLVDEGEQAGARLEFVTEKFEDTAIGRFILAARAFIAEVEREKIVERTMRGKLRRAQEGKIVQGTGIGIFGYTTVPQNKGGDGRRRINHVEAAIVQRIYGDFAGGKSFHSIAMLLNAEGIETKQRMRCNGQRG